MAKFKNRYLGVQDVEIDVLIGVNFTQYYSLWSSQALVEHPHLDEHSLSPLISAAIMNLGMRTYCTKLFLLTLFE